MSDDVNRGPRGYWRTYREFVPPEPTPPSPPPGPMPWLFGTPPQAPSNPPLIDYFGKWKKFEPNEKPSQPPFPNLGPGPKTRNDGYPWWVDPSTVPISLNSPSVPPFPSRPQGPSSRTDPPDGAPTNWLLSYYDQNRGTQPSPINSAPGDSASGAAPSDNAGGLLGMLYATARQGAPNPDRGFDPNPQGPSQQETPEWRLGRRTYRA